VDDAGGRLIARAGELDRLALGWSAATAGASRTVIVAGEAGIGKSTLVRVFADRVRSTDGRVLGGACLPLGVGDRPYGPFVEALRGLLRTLQPGEVPAIFGPDRAELARLLPELRPRHSDTAAANPASPPPAGLGGGLEDRYTQVRLFEVVLGVIDRLARVAPLAVVVEDVQWADASTMDLLEFLVRSLRGEPVLLIVTLRTDDLPDGSPVARHLGELERLGQVERIDLTRLDRPGVARLIEAELGSPPDADVVAGIWDRSGGNPFYVEQLVAASKETSLGRNGTHDANGHHGHPGHLPPRLRDVVVARLDSVSPAGQEVLRVASAAGGAVDDELVATVADLPAADLRDALREVTGRRILETDGTGPDARLVFHHALLREVVHADLLPGERSRLHARYAAALDARLADRASGRWAPGSLPSPAQVAYHWDASGDERRALPATIDAGRAAQRTFAWSDAYRLDRRALELWERVPDAATITGLERVDLLGRAADAAVLAGEYAAAVELGREALSAVDPAADPVRAAGLHDRLRWYLWESGDRAAAARAIDDAERLVPASPPSAARARILAHRAAARMDAGRYADSAADAEAAVEMARNVRSAADEALGLGILGWDLALLGRIDDGAARLRDAIAIADSIDNAEGVALGTTNLAVLLDRVGRTSDAHDVAMDGWERARVLGVERTYGGVLLAVAAKTAIALGRWDEAAEVIAMGLERDPGGIAGVRLRVQQVRLATWRGQEAIALASLDEIDRAGGIVRAIDDRAAVLAAAAELAASGGRTNDARAAVDQAFGLAGDGPPDPALAQLAATGLRVEADAALAARSRHDVEALETARTRAGRIAEIVEQMAARIGVSPESRPSRALAFTLQCRAEARRADDADAAEAWARAATTWEAIDRPFPVAAARYRAAAATLRDHGSREDAAALLSAARDSAARLGARPLLDAIDTLARQARLDLRMEEAAGPSAPPSGSGDAYGLTERELEILRLIAGGWSNRQIADALFISPKTASVHASHIFDKLGASNRTEAGAIAMRVGLIEPPPPPPGSTAL
jgi:DNA-binding NarL/FixJ family response regulator